MVVNRQSACSETDFLVADVVTNKRSEKNFYYFIIKVVYKNV
jgi:hypothetical protein